MSKNTIIKQLEKEIKLNINKKLFINKMISQKIYNKAIELIIKS